MLSTVLGFLHLSFWDLVVFFLQFSFYCQGFSALLERSHEARSFAINKRGVFTGREWAQEKSAIGFGRIRRMGRTNGTGMNLIPRS
jgi:hypothetical protein